MVPYALAALAGGGGGGLAAGAANLQQRQQLGSDLRYSGVFLQLSCHHSAEGERKGRRGSGGIGRGPLTGNGQASKRHLLSSSAD